MKKTIFIDGVTYSVDNFWKKYGFSESKANKLYSQGYEGKQLLDKLSQEQLTINGQKFKSKLQAANYYHIPPTTFYRHLKNGDIDKLIKRKQVLEKYGLN